MTRQSDNFENDVLRQSAEDRQEWQPAGTTPEGHAAVQQALHELYTHHIELARRNEELQRTRNALRDSESQHRMLSELASDCICRIAPDGRCRYASPSCRKVFGHDPEDFLADAALPERLVHPADRFAYRKHLDHSRIAPGHELEFRIRRPDGSEAWVAQQCQPIHDEAGNFYGLRSSTRDITERKCAEAALAESEAQYRAVIETAADSFWMLDGQGRILAVNDAYARRSGYSREELLGMHIKDLEARGSADDISHHIAKLKREGSDHFETLHRAKTGEIWPVEINAAYWASAGGRFFAFARDLTERKRTEARLQTMHAEMERLMQVHVAGQTVAALAHELNQPLNAVASYAEAALRLLRAGSPQQERLQRAIEGSAEQAHRAGQVVRELLAFLRKGEVQTEAVALNDVVLGLAAKLDADGSRAVRTRLDLEADLPPVKADRLQIEKVLANLLHNGIEAMLEAQVDHRLIAITVRTAAESNLAQVTVSDHGPGIDSAALQHIFDPFFTTKPTGLGMGLAVSRAIIEAHGGQLWADTDQGRGANFHFTLPFAT